MESRELILGKLRDTRRAHAIRGEVSGALKVYSPEAIFADIPDTDPLALFTQFSSKLKALKGEVFSVASLEAAGELIAKIAFDAGFTACGRQRHPLLDRLFGSSPALAALESKMTLVEDGVTLPHSSIEAMQCAFTVTDALIARTGSVVLRSSSAGGRRLSVLPPVHCVVALREQLLPCLSLWLDRVKDSDDWSFGTIITGPSRTADIERILVLGAHGPKRLIVVVIG